MATITIIKETLIDYSVRIDGKHFSWIKKVKGGYSALHGTPHAIEYRLLSEAKEYATDQAQIEYRFSPLAVD